MSDWRTVVRRADAVLFDFDGTLAPNLDLPDLRRRVVALTISHGVPETVLAGHYIVETLEAGAAWLARRDAAAASALRRDGHLLIREFELTAARSTTPGTQGAPSSSCCGTIRLARLTPIVSSRLDAT